MNIFICPAYNGLLSNEIGLSRCKIGCIQPIGDRAIPGQIVDSDSTANFVVGAFLLAACEMARFSKQKEISV